MQISMEILSQITPRADSGAGVRQRAGPDNREGLRFDKLFNEAIGVSEGKYTEIKKPKSESGTSKLPAEARAPDDKTEDASSAGAAGNPAMVVFVLEGDRESTIFPETRIDTAAVSTIPEDLQGRNTGADFDPGLARDSKPENTAASPPQFAGDVLKEAMNNGTPDVNAAENRAAANGLAAEVAKKTEAPEINSGSETAGANGEVMARTPIRTSQREGYEDNKSDSSAYGDPRPLENENDSAPVKGQKNKAFSDLVNNLRKTDESAQPANNAPMPLAEGLKPEQFRADQQMRKELPDAPVKASNLFDEMVSRIDTMQSESRNAMTIQLKPEFLGKVALEIALDAAGLHVRINAENGDVRSVINGQINSLIESLQNKGIAVVEVEVAYTGIDNGAFKESRDRQAEPEHHRRRTGQVETIDSATYITALPYDMLDYYLDTEVSSVEYRA